MISFKGKHFLKPIILMVIRWYVAYALSYRDIEEILKERGLLIDHATINRWVIEYAPQLAANFKKKKKAVKYSWRMDESYVKVKGKWMYQYRAVGKDGNTIDCYFSNNRSKKAALKEINKGLDKSQKIRIRQNKYLNNIVEQDHRFIKKITRATLGFKAEYSASATLQGIELHHMLRKVQHVDSNRLSIFEQFYSLAA